MPRWREKIRDPWSDGARTVRVESSTGTRPGFVWLGIMVFVFPLLELGVAGLHLGKVWAPTAFSVGFLASIYAGYLANFLRTVRLRFDPVHRSLTLFHQGGSRTQVRLADVRDAALQDRVVMLRLRNGREVPITSAENPGSAQSLVESFLAHLPHEAPIETAAEPHVQSTMRIAVDPWVSGLIAWPFAILATWFFAGLIAHVWRPVWLENGMFAAMLLNWSDLFFRRSATIHPDGVRLRYKFGKGRFVRFADVRKIDVKGAIALVTLESNKHETIRGTDTTFARAVNDAWGKFRAHPPPALAEARDEAK
jgi:hypothetical protein